MKPALFVGLLRGINVSGRNQIPMAELRSVCEKLKWSGVQSYIQSGNLVFTAGGAPSEIEKQLEQAITRRALDIPFPQLSAPLRIGQATLRVIHSPRLVRLSRTASC